MEYDLTRRAERAALGAMICDQQLAARLDCLVPGDFTDPRHRAVFDAVRLLRHAPEGTAGNWPDLIARTAGGIATREYLDDLAGACPDPAHGPAYAAMLIQANLYRLARHRATQVDAQAALPGHEGSRLSGARAAEAMQATGPDSHLAEVARAIRAHTATLVPGLPDAVAGPSASAARLQAGPAEAVPLSPGPSPGSVQAAPVRPAHPAPATLAEQREEIILSALLQNHEQARQVLGFLPAAAFTSPGRQEVFRAARRLYQSGRPVDGLTVGWEIATSAAVTAFLSPETERQPQAPDGYADSLASSDIGTGQSPLRIARELDAQLQYRVSRRRQDRTPSAPSSGSPVPAHKPARARAQEPSAPPQFPLVQPPNAAEGRPAGPERKR